MRYSRTQSFAVYRKLFKVEKFCSLINTRKTCLVTHVQPCRRITEKFSSIMLNAFNDLSCSKLCLIMNELLMNTYNMYIYYSMNYV